MAANVSVIGRTTRVTGRVTGAVDLEVQGFVDGEIAIDGDVTVDAHGLVGASIQGRRLVVRGAVRGDLVGEESVHLEEGARVIGDVRAPRVAIATGALVRGYVETGESNGAPARAGRTAQAAQPAPRVASPVARAAAAPLPRAATPGAATAANHAAAAPAAAPSRPGARAAVPTHVAGAHGANNSGHGAPRRPPPPVVPALKKAKGQIAKKKER